ncbi:hypothetical protein AB0E27_37670 [Streptomyces sparsogenes]
MLTDAASIVLALFAIRLAARRRRCRSRRTRCGPAGTAGPRWTFPRPFSRCRAPFGT